MQCGIEGHIPYSCNDARRIKDEWDEWEEVKREIRRIDREEKTIYEYKKHNERCNECNKQIEGIKFTCLVDNTCLCEKCEYNESRRNRHSGGRKHIFKITY